MCRLTIEARWRIIVAWEELQSIPEAAKQLSYSQRLVRHWVQRYNASGGVEDLPRSGRKHSLSDQAKATAHDLLLSNQHGGAQHVAERLFELGLSHKQVGRNTIIRAARLVAKQRGNKIKAYRGKPQKILSMLTKQRRLKFSKEQRTRSWKAVMFTDRKKFNFYHPGTSVLPVTWGTTARDRQAYTVNHAACVNLYAGVTQFGMTKIHVVAGTTKHKAPYANKQGGQARNITAMEYRDVLTKTLLPEGRRLFGTQGISTWVLQQDNDPTHRSASAIVDGYNLKHGCSISVLKDWPPSSPDLSLIETVWAYLQGKMDKKGCKTFDEFKAALIKEVKAVPRHYTKKLFAGMPKRLAACITLEGDLTGY